MPRRKQAAEAAIEESPAPPDAPQATDAKAMPPERQPGDEPPEQPKKQWAKRSDPFGSHGHYWKDGYRIGYQESERNREAQIKFGKGNKEDQPKNFEEIKAFLKENQLHWNPEDKAWGKRLRNRWDADTRADVENLLPEIVKLEEKKRGPSAGTVGEERERGF